MTGGRFRSIKMLTLVKISGILIKGFLMPLSHYRDIRVMAKILPSLAFCNKAIITKLLFFFHSNSGIPTPYITKLILTKLIFLKKTIICVKNFRLFVMNLCFLKGNVNELFCLWLDFAEKNSVR